MHERLTRLILLSVAAFFCAPATQAFADAIVDTKAMTATTILEVFVDAKHVRVELEVGAKDWPAFRNSLPDEAYAQIVGKSEPPVETRNQTFLKDDFVIFADGRPLQGELLSVEPGRRVVRDQVTGEPLPLQPMDAERVVRVTIAYALDSRPKQLTFQPSLNKAARLVANIGFVVYHSGVAVNDFRYLSRGEQLDLDWDDPWYSRFENRNLLRRFREPAAAYIYVEQFEVRKEILFRARDLQEWVDLGLEGASVVKAGQRDKVGRLAAQFLASQTPLSIHGKTLAGKLDRVHFVRRTLRTSGVVEPGTDISLDTALLGAIYVYPRESLPQKVEMQWDLFNERIQLVPTATSDEAGDFPSFMTPDDSALVWLNYLKNPTKARFMEVPSPPPPPRWPAPVASILCLVAAVAVWFGRTEANTHPTKHNYVRMAMTVSLVVIGLLTRHWTPIDVAMIGASPEPATKEQASSVMLSLLSNLYRSFDYRDEEQIYDVLDRSVAGDLLGKVYLQTRQSLTLANQGGARVKVKNVDVVESRLEPGAMADEFTTQCTWIVTGAVGHWGHIHQRQNQYRAEFQVRVVDDQWKIIGMEVLSEERL